MHKFFLNTALVFLFVSPVVTADSIAALPDSLQAGWKTISVKNLRHNVYYLASDKLAGRFPLQKGDNIAIDWLVYQFKRAGLQPAFGNSYLQAVPIVEFKADKANSFFAFHHADHQQKWHYPQANFEYPQNIHVTAPLVFVGYGITAPGLQYDDYTNVDVRGKIVLAFEHEPQEEDAQSVFNGIANTIYATNRVKALTAQEHGALALIVMPEPNRHHPSNQERYMRIGGSITRKEPLLSQALEHDTLHIPIVVVSDSIAHTLIHNQFSIKQRQADLDNSLQAHSEDLKNTTVTIHNINSQQRKGVTYNVAGILPGSGHDNETVMVSAHHDHDGKSGHDIWHGADDNASGTAGVVALANAFHAQQKAGFDNQRTILFTVFGAEERGLLGSFYMADHSPTPLNKIKAIINFDMIGRDEQPSLQTENTVTIPRDTHNRLNLIGGHYSPELIQRIQYRNRCTHLTLDERFDNEHALNVFFRSDQFPFILKNIPALWFFTGFHPDYHQISDTANKLNYAKMQKILRLTYLTLNDLANTPNPPKFIPNPGVKS